MVLKLKEINRAFHYDKTSVEEVLSTFEAVASSSKDDVEYFLKEKAFDKVSQWASSPLLRCKRRGMKPSSRIKL